MLYSVLIYDSEATVEALEPEEDQARLARHVALQKDLRDDGALGPVARLMPSTAAVTLRSRGEKAITLDGPFAETKEQLVGFYIFDCASLQEALDRARQLPLDSGSLEVRPIRWYEPGIL